MILQFRQITYIKDVNFTKRLRVFSINFEMTITNFLQSDWSTQPDSQVIVTGRPLTITFFKIAPYCIAIMHEDIGKFV